MRSHVNALNREIGPLEWRSSRAVANHGAIPPTIDLVARPEEVDGKASSR